MAVSGKFFTMWGGVVGAVLAGAILLSSGCTAQQRKVVEAAISSNPTATIVAEYAGLDAKVDAATTVIQENLGEMDQADRVALQIVFVEINRLRGLYDLALEDETRMKALIARGVKTYRKALPILLNNHEVFSGDELRILAEADSALREFRDDASAVTSAVQLKRMFMMAKRVLEISGAVVL